MIKICFVLIFIFSRTRITHHCKDSCLCDLLCLFKRSDFTWLFDQAELTYEHIGISNLKIWKITLNML